MTHSCRGLWHFIVALQKTIVTCYSFLKHDHPFQRVIHRLAEGRGVEAARPFVFAEVDDQDLVFVHVHYGLKFRLQRHAVNVTDRTEEDRVLPVLSVAFADLEDLTETFWVADVVADQVAVAHRGNLRFGFQFSVFGGNVAEYVRPWIPFSVFDELCYDSASPLASG